MPHCTTDFAWYLGKFLVGFAGMLIFYMGYLKEKEFICLCNARMRELERQKAENCRKRVQTRGKSQEDILRMTGNVTTVHSSKLVILSNNTCSTGDRPGANARKECREEDTLVDANEEQQWSTEKACCRTKKHVKRVAAAEGEAIESSNVIDTASNLSSRFYTKRNTKQNCRQKFNARIRESHTELQQKCLYRCCSCCVRNGTSPLKRRIRNSTKNNIQACLSEDVIADRWNIKDLISKICGIGKTKATERTDQMHNGEQQVIGNELKQSEHPITRRTPKNETTTFRLNEVQKENVLSSYEHTKNYFIDDILSSCGCQNDNAFSPENFQITANSAYERISTGRRRSRDSSVQTVRISNKVETHLSPTKERKLKALISHRKIFERSSNDWLETRKIGSDPNVGSSKLRTYRNARDKRIITSTPRYHNVETIDTYKNSINHNTFMPRVPKLQLEESDDCCYNSVRNPKQQKHKTYRRASQLGHTNKVGVRRRRIRRKNETCCNKAQDCCRIADHTHRSQGSFSCESLSTPNKSAKSDQKNSLTSRSSQCINSFRLNTGMISTTCRLSKSEGTIDNSSSNYSMPVILSGKRQMETNPWENNCNTFEDAYSSSWDEQITDTNKNWKNPDSTVCYCQEHKDVNWQKPIKTSGISTSSGFSSRTMLICANHENIDGTCNCNKSDYVYHMDKFISQEKRRIQRKNEFRKPYTDREKYNLNYGTIPNIGYHERKIRKDVMYPSNNIKSSLIRPHYLRGNTNNSGVRTNQSRFSRNLYSARDNRIFDFDKMKYKRT